MATKTKNKKKAKDEEEEEETPKKKSKKEEPEEEETVASTYAGEKQPRWVTDEPNATFESPAGFRIHVWDKNVMITGKDWEGEDKQGNEGIHPGKTVKMPTKEFVALINNVLKGMGFKGPEITLGETEEEEDEE